PPLSRQPGALFQLAQPSLSLLLRQRPLPCAPPPPSRQPGALFQLAQPWPVLPPRLRPLPCAPPLPAWERGALFPLALAYQVALPLAAIVAGLSRIARSSQGAAGLLLLQPRLAIG